MTPYPKYLDWLRYLCAYLLLTYGLSKLIGVQFTLSPDIASKPVGALTGYQLTWYYYSYSHAYAGILGAVQLVGGILLLFRKTALAGAALMAPVIGNILMINVFFHIALGAECAAAFIFASLSAILWRERPALLDIFWTRQANPPASPRLHRSIAALVVAIVIAQTAAALLYMGRNR